MEARLPENPFSIIGLRPIEPCSGRGPTRWLMPTNTFESITLTLVFCTSMFRESFGLRGRVPMREAEGLGTTMVSRRRSSTPGDGWSIRPRRVREGTGTLVSTIHDEPCPSLPRRNDHREEPWTFRI